MVNEPNPILRRLLTGAIAGLAATVPMTLFMLAAKQKLPRRQQYRLPPREIVARVAEKVKLREEIDQEPEETTATTIGHFGYGALTGALYGLLLAPINISSILKGILFGVLVWSGSYLGWLPAAGLYPSVKQISDERNLLMMASHWVFGAFTGMIADKLSKQGIIQEDSHITTVHWR